jgi:hypothetical protein
MILICVLFSSVNLPFSLYFPRKKNKMYYYEMVKSLMNTLKIRHARLIYGFLISNSTEMINS